MLTEAEYQKDKAENDRILPEVLKEIREDKLRLNIMTECVLQYAER